VYFSKEPVSPEQVDPEQLRALREYRSKLQKRALTGDYASLDELEGKLQRHLTQVIAELAVKRMPASARAVAAELKEDKPKRGRKKSQQYAAGSQSSSDYETIYDVENSSAFYDEIAPFYDARNSAELLEAQYAVIRELRLLVKGREEARILDLGGGTGLEIAAYFALEPELSWTYVDVSEGMARAFRQNFQPADLHTSVVLGDVRREIGNLVRDGRRFDAIVVSWLLSSMPTDVDFGSLTELLAVDGKLIVADAAPENLAARPLYGFVVGKRHIALRLRPISPAAVEATGREHGLALVKPATTVFRADRLPYAFVQVYEREVF
jgi:SAM-dependent methyltransferase